MDIMLLREFLALAHYSNYTEAARAIPVSQSTLSKHIQSMERELGYSLVERDTQRVALTQRGRIVAERAASIVSDFDRMKRELEQGAQKRIELSIGGVFQDRFIMKCFYEAKQVLESRGISCFFNFRIDASRPLVHELTTGDLDVLVSPPQFTENGSGLFGSRLLYASPFIACVHKDDPIASEPIINMADIRSMVFIRLVGNHFKESWDFIESLCLDNGFTPSTRECFLGSPHELSLLKINRNEVFLVCEASLQDVIFLTDPDLVQVPVSNATFPILCYFSKEPLSDDVRLFLEALEETRAE